MKKYLFLLLMFIVYLCLLIKKNTKEVIDYVQDNNNSFVFVDIYFKNGINSKTLSNGFKRYNSEYLVKKINLDDNSIDLNCKRIDKCISYIYDINDNNFYDKYIASGFSINKLTLITDKNYIINYLKNKDYLYKIY